MISFAKFSQHLSTSSNIPNKSNGVKELPDKYLPAVLYECLTHEKTEIINLYLSLNHSLRNLCNGNTTHLIYDILNIKLVISYYRSNAHLRIGLNLEPLIQSGYVASLEVIFR